MQLLKKLIDPEQKDHYHHDEAHHYALCRT